MSVSRREEKAQLLLQHRRHETDTGSAEVQIALCTLQINALNKHFKQHRKDLGSKRGLFQSIGKRKRLLQYLRKRDESRYQEIIKVLSIRK